MWKEKVKPSTSTFVKVIEVERNGYTNLKGSIEIPPGSKPGDRIAFEVSRADKHIETKRGAKIWGFLKVALFKNNGQSSSKRY